MERRRWTGSGHELEFARDTQRLGRYEDDSQIEWSQVPVQPPDYIEDVSGLEVRFMYDAGGSDGDRNLFVAELNIKVRVIQRPSAHNFQAVEEMKKIRNVNPAHFIVQAFGNSTWPLCRARPMHRNLRNRFLATSIHGIPCPLGQCARRSVAQYGRGVRWLGI